MHDELFPRHYEAWKYCITEKCGIKLTKEYVEERLAALSNDNSEERKKFIEKFGLDWTNKIVNYFNNARSEYLRS